MHRLFVFGILKKEHFEGHGEAVFIDKSDLFPIDSIRSIKGVYGMETKQTENKVKIEYYE
ncbi:MAG: hypothetical protein Q8N83_14495 [Ignavibacteria bacterium]|nr:hypothetical protein [Ignavibacteria bacterium]